MGCSEPMNDMQLADLKDHNMKIIPETPTGNDEIKLVIFDDCTYNVLSGITRSDRTIDIQKQFNSMMKWPCVVTNDTISMGKLPEGNYVVNYKLVDIAPQTTNPTVLSFSFGLTVKN
jgi:hypothetical protein